MKEYISTEKDVNLDTSAFQFEALASLVKVAVNNTVKLFSGSLLTARKWFKCIIL